MSRRSAKRLESHVVKSQNEKAVEFEAEKIMFPSNSASAKKIVLNFPTQLLERTDSAAELLHTDRSKLIRDAVEERVREVERVERSRQLRAAYREHGQAALELYREFEATQMEILGRVDS